MDISAENYQYQLQQQQPQQQQDYQYQQSYDPSQHQQLQTSYNQTSNPQSYYYDYNNTTQQQQQHQYYYPPYHYTHSYPPPQQTHLPNYSNSYYNHPIGSHPPSSSNLSGGIVDGSPISMQSQIGKSTHRGGKRGGRPFRGGGRGHSARGRGQGGGRNLSMPPSASVPCHAQVPAAPLQPPPRIAWCELCRVDCNTMEILEQHKNGKKHKKNLKMHEGLQNLNNNTTGQKNVQINSPEVKADLVQSEEVGGSNVKQNPENLPPVAITVDNENGSDQQKDDVGESKESGVYSAEVAKKKSWDHFEGQGRGLKRKVRGGRGGGKYMRPHNGPRRPVEPPKPKEVVPFMCQLCNVKCESQVVFDSHLAGKKHLAKLKRFHSHQALYGEAGLQALYPPNLDASSTSAIPQMQQVINDPQVVLAQLLNYVLSQAQASGAVEAHLPLLAGASAAVVARAAVAPAPTLAPAPGSNLEMKKDVCVNQGSETICKAGNEVDTASKAGCQQQQVTAEFKTPSIGTPDLKDENGSVVTEASDATHNLDIINSTSLPQDDINDAGPTVDSSITASSVENIDLEQKQVTAASSDNAVQSPQDLATK